MRARTIKTALEQQGFAVRCAGDGPAGLALVAEQIPDLLLVNAVLPRMPGIDVCRHLRRAGLEIPIIVLSPRSDEIDVVVAMEIGADDFIAEPYGMRELVARVRAVLRRSDRRVSRQQSVTPPHNLVSGGQTTDAPETGAAYGSEFVDASAPTVNPRSRSRGAPSGVGSSDPVPDILQAGDVILDRARHEVLLRGRPIDLPRREFILLESLLEKPGRLVTREVLIERIWGPGFWGSSKILSTLVGRLRARIESDEEYPPRVVTIRGIGYRYEASSEEDS